MSNAEPTPRRLRVVVADPRIVKIFEITGLTSVFSIADSLESAGTA